jgi:uncharacterized membrane protein
MSAATATADAGTSETPLFTAVLRPYRSLSPRGFSILMTAIVACTFAIGLAFWLAGAWPVVGFCGLDILLIQFAFRANYRAARATEEIRLTRDRLSVTQTTPRGIATETDFNPYWSRLEVDRHPEFGVTRVRIASHGNRLDVASFLGPRERENFAAALGAAMAEARALPAA